MTAPTPPPATGRDTRPYCLRCEVPIYQDDEGVWRREATGSQVCPRNPAVDGHEPSDATCPHCGGPMTSGGVALLCGLTAGGGRVEFPPSCPSRECAQARDAAAIERAIASGLIDP